MRKALPFVALILVLASPAGAQPQAAPTLRGSQSADTPAPVGPSAPRPGTPAVDLAPQVPIPLRTLAETPVGGEAGQCRLTCAQSYYFCLATEGAEDCGPTWGQCRAKCDAPSAVADVFPG